MSRRVRRMLRLPDPVPGSAVTNPASPPKPVPPGVRPWQVTPDPRRVALQDAGMAGFYRKATGEVFEGVPVGPDDVVVDVGCREPVALGFCADQGAAIVAVAEAQETLDAARDLLRDSPAQSQTFHHGSEHLDSESATRVLCLDLLERVADPRRVLRELQRIGQPGALYLLTVPDARGEELTQLVGPEDYFEPPNHVRVVGRDEFEQWVTETGLEILAHRFSGFFWVLWYSLFWGRGVVPEAVEDPVLKHWTIAWKALLDSANGAEIQAQFDEFMPKNQVIVARRPAE